jgi:hypothetical protein
MSERRSAANCDKSTSRLVLLDIRVLVDKACTVA